MSETLLITADRVWTGSPGEDAATGAGVLVEDGRVAAVGPAAGLGAARHVHVPGGTVLPGLIDGHVHLAFTPGVNPGDAIPPVDDVDLFALMVRGDPTTDLAALHDVALVVRAGQVVHTAADLMPSG